MDAILTNVNWPAIVVGFVLSFAFGALWYSPKMFGLQWMKAVGLKPEDAQGNAHAMVSQAVGTFLLSWAVGITAELESIQFAVLIALALAIIVKSNGLWAQKNMTAIKIESGFILAMVVLMIAVHAFM